MLTKLPYWKNIWGGGGETPSHLTLATPPLLIQLLHFTISFSVFPLRIGKIVFEVRVEGSF